MTELRHQPLREGYQRWVHRLPRPGVVRDRGRWIADRSRGQTVAHLGFADTGCEVSRGAAEDWLHARLAAQASRLVGLDLTAEAVEAARRNGYEAYQVDCSDGTAVRDLGLPRFDLVVIGELIEHVDNPGGLLTAASRLVSRDGSIIVTTPNARRLVDVLYAAVGREVVHPDHVAVYSVRTLCSLLARAGWEIDAVSVYLNPPPPRRPRTYREWLARAGRLLQSGLVLSTSPYLADGLIVVARPTD